MNCNNKKSKVKSTGLTNTNSMMKQESINKNTKKMSTRNSKKNTKHEKQNPKNKEFFMNENCGTFMVKATLTLKY
jgi:hypothetical protein